MQLEVKEANTGYLIPFNISDIPFEAKRCFFVQNNKAGDIRGNHAHINEEHFLICLSGHVKITKESSSGVEEFTLSSGQVLYQKELEWLRLEYISDNTSILVFADALYEESNYVRNYEDFRNMIKDRK
jgi:dTDP-4-dehydrorhamnose 3,5-epimerase-like enzyme